MTLRKYHTTAKSTFVIVILIGFIVNYLLYSCLFLHVLFCFQIAILLIEGSTHVTKVLAGSANTYVTKLPPAHPLSNFKTYCVLVFFILRPCYYAEFVCLFTFMRVMWLASIAHVQFLLFMFMFNLFYCICWFVGEMHGLLVCWICFKRACHEIAPHMFL